MKKFSAIIFSFLAVSQIANSQEAFKHLSAGLEIGTTGVGIQVAVPVVSDHLVLTAGYNYANFPLHIEENSFDFSDLSDGFNNYVNDGNSFLSGISGENRRLTKINNTATTAFDAKFKLGAFKAILEYYPINNGSFHISAGVYAGDRNLLDVNGAVPEYWNEYKSNLAIVQDVIRDYPDYPLSVGDVPDLKATINDRTFQIMDDGVLNLGIESASVRPYLGIGFGRSIPESRFGFQFDLGAIYTGKFKIVSANEVEGTSDVSILNDNVKDAFNTIEKLCIYPQLSFRLTYKLF